MRSADANADQRISVEDALQLINYYYANGAAPPPSRRCVCARF
ncbi:MAG: hypothetical protein ACXW29_03565 [Thermoanaerobaculia bacterium]